MKNLAQGLGVTWPTDGDWAAAGAALLIAIAAWGLAWLVGRWLGPRLAAFREHRAGHRGGALAARMCDLTRI